MDFVKTMTDRQLMAMYDSVAVRIEKGETQLQERYEAIEEELNLRSLMALV